MNNQFNSTLVVGLVGHLHPKDLKDFTELIEQLPYFKTVFFRTSSEKLWIKEGDPK